MGLSRSFLQVKYRKLKRLQCSLVWLKAANAETILARRALSGQGSAEAGITSLQTNCGSDERYEKKAANGKHYFNLKAANHQVIGTSQMYSSSAARDDGIASVKSNGTTNTVKDNTQPQ